MEITRGRVPLQTQFLTSLINFITDETSVQEAPWLRRKKLDKTWVKGGKIQ